MPGLESRLLGYNILIVWGLKASQSKHETFFNLLRKKSCANREKHRIFALRSERAVMEL